MFEFSPSVSLNLAPSQLLLAQPGGTLALQLGDVGAVDH